ncbi:MAG: PaaI family thioesterase [Chitinivibrionales bacterium]
MSTERDRTHFAGLESMYYAAPINTMYKPSISVSRGSCVIEMAADNQFFHSGGTLHGSIYFKMLDDAAFFAANSLSREFLLSTAQFSLHFIRAAGSGMITATGEILQRGKLLSVAESRLFDHKERLIAKGSGSFVSTGVLLKDAHGYTGEG